MRAVTAHDVLCVVFVSVICLRLASGRNNFVQSRQPLRYKQQVEWLMLVNVNEKEDAILNENVKANVILNENLNSNENAIVNHSQFTILGECECECE